MPTTSHLLCGRDHETYGVHHVRRISVHTACAISVGADVEFAKELEKKHPNEDALLVLEDDRHTVLCVADAHFGREASEHLLQVLEQELRPIPENPALLAERFERLSSGKSRTRYASETTLAVCIFDRLFQQAFGLSFGDSSVIRALPGQTPVRMNERTQAFVSLGQPRSLRPRGAKTFGGSMAPGELLVVYTDGVDECCYREPDRSITPFVLRDILNGADLEPLAATEALVRAALAGVNGHPGGQDNVALAITRA